MPLRSRVSLAAIVLGSLAAGGYAALRAADRATHAFLHRDRIPVEAIPDEYGLTPEQVTFPSPDGLRIAAWYFPSRNGAAIILCHGLGGNRSGVIDFAHFLVGAGYGALLFDFRAHGDSEGEAISLGYYEALDVVGAAEFLKGRADVDPVRIGLMGISLGGSAAILGAAQCPDIRAVVVDSTFTSIRSMVRRQFKTFIDLPAFLAPIVVWAGQRQLKVKASQIEPIARIAAISPRPVFLIHGTADAVIGVENGHELYEAAGDPKELWIVPDSPHASALTTHGEEYVRKVIGFFDVWVQGTGSGVQG